MQLVCRSCGEGIRAEDINLERAIAKCARCNALFGFGDQFPSESAPAPKREVELPKRMTVVPEGEALCVSYRWFGPAVLGLAFFCVFWDGFMIVWYSIAISQRQWAMAAFGTIHGLVGAALTYGVLAGFLNTTRIRANRRGFEVTHGPIPCPGIDKLVPGAIEQIYCEEKLKTTKNGTSRTYKVEAIVEGRGRETIVDNLQSSETALYIEQALERHLEIVDRPVSGDFRG